MCLSDRHEVMCCGEGETAVGKHIAFAYLPIEYAELGMEVEVMYLGRGNGRIPLR